jgi:hypothetical protein
MIYSQIMSFGHLNFENLKIVSNFDIRISDFVKLLSSPSPPPDIADTAPGMLL